MRFLVVFLALAVATPAAAQSQALLDCPAQGVTPAFREKLADSVLQQESAANNALFEQLAAVTDECAGRLGLTQDKGEAYFTYSLARVSREVLAVRLGTMGIPATAIDQAFDFGEGRANPVLTGDFSEAQLAGLFAALTAKGVNIEKLPDASGEMIGAYAATSSLMWQARRKLQ